MKWMLYFQKRLKTTLIKLRLFNFVSKAQNRTFKFLRAGYTPKDFWNKWSDSYFSQPARTKFDTAHEWLKSRFAKISPRQILEVGCGFGRNIQFISETAGGKPSIYGMDISEEMLKKASGFIKSHGARLCAGDITALPFKDNSFDLVFTYGTLMHVPPDKCGRAFGELLRISKRHVIIIEEVLLSGAGRVSSRQINDYTFIHDYSGIIKPFNITVADKQQHKGLVDLLCLHCEKKK
jgi:ubiquinone/menaquinone biosynthesis C-methylase UbiE